MREEAANWVLEEIKGIDFDNTRLDNKYGNILSSFSSRPNESLSKAALKVEEKQ
jgi:hypothetical protein